MADKNPKHPLKKKKVAQKVNVANHDSEDDLAESGRKSKKHTY